MKQKVVIIGHGYTSRLGVIRALGRVGYDVTVIVMTHDHGEVAIHHQKPIDCYSKYVRRILYCPSVQERLIRLLLDECVEQEQKVVVLPDSDFSAAAIDLNQERLKEHFLFPSIGGKQGEVVAWMDKLRQKRLAREVGLNVANGCVVDVKKGQYEIPTEVLYPCFPKPLATIVGGKRGLRRCDNEQQLRQVIDGLIVRNQDLSILVEEYKQIEVEQALMGVTDGRQVYIPGVIRTSSLAKGAHMGVAIKGELMPTGELHSLVEGFKQFVLRTGFVGVFDIDFYRSDGRYYFCEMNFRYGGSGYVYTAKGVNLPALTADVLCGKNLDKAMPKITDIAFFVNERMLKDNWSEGLVSTRMFLKTINSGDISFVFDDDDPEPGRQFRKSLRDPNMNIKRIAKRILKITGLR